MAGLLGIVAAMYFANSSSAWLYPFGLLGVDAGVGLLIVAVVLFPGAVVGRILSARPVRAIGQISYGIYLWHFPLFLWLDADTTGLNGPWLLLFRIGVTLAVSVVSFALIEQPIRKRRIPTPIVRSLAPVAAGGAVVALLVASTIGATAYDAAAAPTPPHSTDKFTGTNPGCSVALQDTKQYGLAPLPRKDATKDIYAWLGAHQLGWNGSTTTTFHTCPPKKVLVVGDSLAFTIGVGLMDDEEHYGVEVANAGILGCAFTTTGELDVGGAWQEQSAGCPNALRSGRRTRPSWTQTRWLSSSATATSSTGRSTATWSTSASRTSTSMCSSRSSSTSTCSAAAAPPRSCSSRSPTPGRRPTPTARRRLPPTPRATS